MSWRRLWPISLAHAWRSASSWTSWRRLWPISLAHAWRSSWTSWRRLRPISLAHAWRSSWMSWRRLRPISLAHAWHMRSASSWTCELELGAASGRSRLRMPGACAALARGRR
eukprot:tig00020629_g12377.t4